MKTVLWWGEAWWLAGEPDPVPVSDPAQAAAVLAARFAGTALPRLRLVCQSPNLATVEAACPAASRSVMAEALAADFPQIAKPLCAWGHEPVLGRSGDYRTLVHYERDPGPVLTLVDALEHCGFTVESVWPLGTFLHALPEEWSESGATNVLALQATGACAYSHGTDGRRAVHAWNGDKAREEAIGWLAGLLAKNADEPVLLVAGETGLAELEGRLPLAGKKTVKCLTLAQALGKRIVLPRNHPAQLVPPGPRVTARWLAIAASIVFLSLAAWSGAGYVRDSLAWRTDVAAREAEKQSLRTEVDRLRANEREIAALRAELAEKPDGPPSAVLLEKVAATVPREVALDRISIEAGRFSLRGHLAPGTAAGAAEAWRTLLADPRWKIEPAGPSGGDGAFALAGEFES